MQWMWKALVVAVAAVLGQVAFDVAGAIVAWPRAYHDAPRDVVDAVRQAELRVARCNPLSRWVIRGVLRLCDAPAAFAPAGRPPDRDADDELTDDSDIDPPPSDRSVMPR